MEPLNLALHKAQGRAFLSRATEILYGGAAGGGKSHLMRAASIAWCSAIPGLQVYLFRRVREDLLKNHMEGPSGYRNLLAPWVQAKLCTIIDDEIRFWNGSKIYLCHCKDENTIYRYQGSEIHVLLIDELTHFTEAMYRFLRNRVRMVGIEVPAEYAGMFPRILCGANPGGVGHLWVKQAFVEAGAITKRRMPNSEGGMLRQFLPARLEDNPSMAESDPGYEQRLEGLGSKALVQAMRWGDWNVVEGAFFDCWDNRRHVLRPMAMPDHWLRFRSGDWGSARPFSFGWWAVVAEPVRTDAGIWLPRGCLIRYREWYGCATDEQGAPRNNTGLKLSAEEVGAGLASREPAEPRVSYGVLDPAAFTQDGGPSIAERIFAGSGSRISFRRADNARVPQRGAMGGWDALRARLVGDSDGNPMVATFSTCDASIRTIPVLQHDRDKPEDLDTEGEDHCFAAGTLVETDKGPVRIERLPPEGVVHAVGRLRPYHSARMTRRDAEIVRVTFEDGRSIRCTPDHRFLEDTGEWRYAKDLLGRSVQCARMLYLPLSKSSTAFGTTAADATSSARVKGSTSLFGNGITGRSLMAAISTMWTRTGATTTLATSNASPSPSMDVCTVLQAGSVGELASPRLALLQQSGMVAKPASGGIASTTNATSGPLWMRRFLQSAKSAAAGISSRLRGSSKVASVQRPAKPVRCVSVVPAGRADVYCLTVPDVECFAIEGGIFVHNCADEWRYACMSRPWVREAPPPQQPPRGEFMATPGAIRGPSITDLIKSAERRARSRD